MHQRTILNPIANHLILSEVMPPPSTSRLRGLVCSIWNAVLGCRMVLDSYDCLRYRRPSVRPEYGIVLSACACMIK